MFKKIVFFSLGLSFAACVNQAELDKKMEDSTQKKILDIHDQLMGKMDRMETLKEKLKNPKLGSNPLYKNNLSDTLLVFNTMKEAYKLLDSGDNSMMNWMNQFKMDYKGKDHKETMNYLQGQLVKVKSIDSMVNDGLKKAESLLPPQK